MGATTSSTPPTSPRRRTTRASYPCSLRWASYLYSYYVRELNNQVKANDRQANYWRGQAFDAWDRAAEQQQNIAEASNEYWNDPVEPPRGVRNPKAQGWRQWRGRGRNMQTSQVPFPIVSEHLTRGAPPDRRTWTRR